MCKDGKEHGTERWWLEDGTKTYEEMWRDGEWHGMETLWYANGKKEYEIYYLDSKAYARIEWNE